MQHGQVKFDMAGSKTTWRL